MREGSRLLMGGEKCRRRDWLDGGARAGEDQSEGDECDAKEGVENSKRRGEIGLRISEVRGRQCQTSPQGINIQLKGATPTGRKSQSLKTSTIKLPVRGPTAWCVSLPDFSYVSSGDGICSCRSTTSASAKK